jgi:hypothetical protein
MSHRREALKLSQLTINTGNPRFEIVGNQRDAIITMIEDQQGKLEKLAADIVQHGLGPHESIIVTPHETLQEYYNVLEGNRRITALKLLDNPGLIPESNKALFQRFKKLSVAFMQKPAERIECVVFQDVTEAYRWIRLMHTGENEGVGRVGWDAQQKGRYEERIEGKTSFALQVLDFLQKQADLDLMLKSRIKDVPSSSLQRLVGDPAFREVVGIDIVDGEVVTRLQPGEIVKPFRKVIADLLSEDFSIKHIYYKEDRAGYINSFGSCELPDYSKELSGSWRLSAYKATIHLVAKEARRSRIASNRSRPTAERNTIIPKSTFVKIDHPAAGNLFRELKVLDTNRFCNAGAATLKVFVELSVGLLVDKLSIGEVQENEKLEKKLEKISAYFKENTYLYAGKAGGDEQMKKAEGLLPSYGCIACIDVLDENYLPEASKLITAWDNIEALIRKIWELI